MSRMVRKQVYIRPEHERLLKRRSRELGVSEADLVRQGIEQISKGAISAPRDRAAWEQELAFIRERARIPGLGLERSWTRDDLYATSSHTGTRSFGRRPR